MIKKFIKFLKNIDLFIDYVDAFKEKWKFYLIDEDSSEIREHYLFRYEVSSPPTTLDVPKVRGDFIEINKYSQPSRMEFSKYVLTQTAHINGLNIAYYMKVIKE